MFIEGFVLFSSKEFQDEVFKFVQKWIIINYKVWKFIGYMFEKFNVSVYGVLGGGGEYKIQIGFGWINGVVLDMLC